MPPVSKVKYLRPPKPTPIGGQFGGPLSIFTPGVPSPTPLPIPNPPRPNVQAQAVADTVDPNEVVQPRIPVKPGIDPVTGQPYADENAQPPAIEPPDISQPPTGEVTTPPVIDPTTGQPYQEATKGRAYYGVIKSGPYANTIAYFVFNPTTRSYVPRQVTGDQWAKVMALPVNQRNQILQSITNEFGGPNWEAQPTGDVTGIAFKQRTQHIVNGQNVVPGQGNFTSGQPATPAVTPATPATRVRKSNIEIGKPKIAKGGIPTYATPRGTPNSMFPANTPDTKGVAPGTIRFAFGKNYVWTLSNGQYQWIPQETAFTPGAATAAT